MKWPVIVIRRLNVTGMALFPFILVNTKAAAADKVVINHEMIHLRQQAELLVIPFYLLYLINYLINLGFYQNHHKAYLNIVFEREAYANELNTMYLKSRRWYSWYKYL
jgi:hypothetical protein